MTWIDNNGEQRPQSWEEYLTMKEYAPAWSTPPQAYQPLRVRADGKISKIRRRLFRVDPHCFWCGRTVFLNVPHATPSLATVDHLYSRLHPQRLNKYREQSGVLHVLACHQCNHDRSVCEQKGRPFIPKLAERLEFAQLADATLAPKDGPIPALPPTKRQVRRANTRMRKSEKKLLEEFQQGPPMRVIQTFEEAVEYARENPAR